jgi:hypothetical protein
MPTFTIPGATTSVVAPIPSKKTNNRRKKTTEPETTPTPEPESEPTPVEEVTSIEDQEHTSPVSEPTFPNIVILKQTDHNYIVKHNHYPVSSSSSSSLNTDDVHLQPLVPDDLVSPNQIHKGQINKKRGRKPKAGLILNSKGGIYDTTEVPNIILHLKCHLSDLKTTELISSYEYTPAISEVESYTTQSNYHQPSDIITQKPNDLDDDDDDDDDNVVADIDDNALPHAEYVATDSTNANESFGTNSSANTTTTLNGNNTRSCDGLSSSSALTSGISSVTTNAIAIQPNNKKLATDATIHIMNDRNQKEIMKKIHRLKYSFHNGETVQTKMNHRPACFWDTCEFDGPIYYIPIMIVNGVFQVNGCYCSPQCAVASLLKEPLDTSTKFERLHLLHLLYGVPNSKGFKPAPNPHYLLDKYYGNLTIQEYRTILKGTQMIHIVNKPLTHILPELYEDNNDFLVNSKVIPANSLKMKKKYKTMVVQSGAE